MPSPQRQTRWRAVRRARGLAFLGLIAIAPLPVASGAPASGAGSPPSPAEARARRDEIRQQQARIAAELEPLKATDDELARALAVVTNNLRAQQARTDDARRAAEDARHRADELAREQEELEGEIESLRSRLRDQAVAAYMNPGGRVDRAGELFTTDDLTGVERQKHLVDSVMGSGADLQDQLRLRREQLKRVRAEAEQAVTEADARQAEAERALEQLAEAEAAQRRVKAAYEQRIAAYENEARQLAAEDAQMQRIILDAEARARAQEEASRKSNEALSGGRVPDAPGQISAVVSAGGCIWPLPGGRVSQEFGGRNGHPGIDIFAPFGTPIYAAKGGEVIFAGWNNGGYGNLVLVDHGGGMVTAYAHQSQVAVSVGQTVRQGQLLGYEGSTGYSTGPHLHFEVRINGQAVNPRSCLG
ncbi:MAG: peptidoglycan DD-metalloendopeptidase family protein [Acidimicrobiales bacterium]|nr:peptidoglycan DD-metalloendopeptidase family protein [Acidimicrobiales bacterium]